MDDLDLKQYCKSLLARIDESRVLKRIEVSDLDWEPRSNDCHENVTEWCKRNQRYSPVRGWLYFDQANGFMHHSVVESPEGEILDITPSDSRWGPYPFIEAGLPERQFFELTHYLGNRMLNVR